MARKPKATALPERDEIVQEARARFEHAQEVWGPIYKRCREDMRFSDPTDPKQWPDDAIRERTNSEGGPRPCFVFDQTSQFVRQVINTARRNKPALNFMPVDDDSDPELAEVLKGLARQTEYQSRADVAYITALEQATRGGIGFFRLCLKETKGKLKGQQTADIKRVVDFESVYVDPDFQEPDGSDMEWGFVEEDMPRAKFTKKWPDAKVIDWDDAGWFTKDTVRVVEYYRIVEDGEKKRCEHFMLSGEDVLESTVVPSSYVPIFPVLGNESWDDGERNLAGCIRLARDPQIAYNYERNSAIEAVAIGPKAPWLAPIEATEGHENEWAQANRGNIPVLHWNSIDDQGNQIQPPSRIQPAGMAAGWMGLEERSKADIQAALGGFESGVGNNPNSQSGRAVIALQDRQDVGTYHYIDNLALSISHCGRVLTEVWPTIYDREQVLRIIGEDDEPEFVRVDPKQKTGYAEVRGPDGKKVVSINPSVGTFDVRATTGPAFQTRQSEAAAEIGEFVNGNPQMLAMFGDVLVKLRNYPEAEKLARRFKAMLPPQVQQAEEAEDGQQQLPPQVMQILQQAQQEIQGLQQQLQEAQSGMQSEQLRAQVQATIAQGHEETARYIAELNAQAAADREAMKDDRDRDINELKAWLQITLQKLQPPPQLAGEVAKDMGESA